jgi:formate dehydrogenase iron-sulfur subunit
MSSHAESISRRHFLLMSAAALGSGAVFTSLCPLTDAEADGATDDQPAMLMDVTRCVGCGNCQRSCNEANHLQPSQDQLGTLSAKVWTVVQNRQAGADQTRFVKRQCMHCLHPACVSACTVGALGKTAEGLVIADTQKCIGCRYCQYACPFGAPKFEWESTLGIIRKCNSCLDRVRAGEMTACAANCPAGALKYGKRADLLAEAHARIQAQPKIYLDHVYGEFEVGGTSRLYLSDVPFDELGLPRLGSEPATARAESVMKQTPTLALSVAAVASAVAALVHRSGKPASEVEIPVKEVSE